MKAQVFGNNNFEVDNSKYNYEDMNIKCVDERNVLIVGKKKIGKSTLLQVLKDPCYEPPQSSDLFRKEQNEEVNLTKLESFCLADENKMIKMNFLELKTPTVISDVLMKDFFKKLAKEMQKKGFKQLHMLMIIISHEHGVFPIEISFFKQLIQEFANPKLNVVICATRCENYSKVKCNEIIAELSHFEPFSIFRNNNESNNDDNSDDGNENKADHRKQRVLFSGCAASIETQTNRDYLLSLYRKISTMRDIIIREIFNSTPIDLNDLPINAHLLKPKKPEPVHIPSPVVIVLANKQAVVPKKSQNVLSNSYRCKYFMVALFKVLVSQSFSIHFKNYLL